MKRGSLKPVHFALGLGFLAAWVAGPRATAQTPAELGIQTYAGLTITGTVGAVYLIDYVTDLAQTNNPGAWRCLEYLQLPASPYLWADQSAPATEKRFYRAAVMEAPTNMVFVPPGTFRMGSPTNEVGRSENEGPQTAVIISRAFWMGKYEVTQGEYLVLMGKNPSWCNGVRWNGDHGVDLNRPVEWVYGENATNYCGRLTQQERVAGRISPNSVYRLPTEAEWEYACRAWTSTRFSYGDDPGYTNLTNYAWYSANSGLNTHPVGQKLPNPWGLYDMHGNVREWCQGFVLGNLPGGILLDPQGTSAIARGGCWGRVGGPPYYNNAQDCRSAHRVSPWYDAAEAEVGFRVVLAPGPP